MLKSYENLTLSPVDPYISAILQNGYLPQQIFFIQNKTLGRARDPHANGTWLSKLTE